MDNIEYMATQLVSQKDYLLGLNYDINNVVLKRIISDNNFIFNVGDEFQYYLIHIIKKGKYFMTYCSCKIFSILL